jgi:alpha-beta hydrolase superfamily lysophospholipase
MTSDQHFVTRDGLKLRALTLHPQGTPRAVVAMVHGLAEHIDRYADLHQTLLGAGLAVAAADLRGFGRSPGARGHINGWADYRADASAILEGARALAPDAPLFLFGHSMGGLIVLDTALNASAHELRGLRGVIASGPALIPGGVRRPIVEVFARAASGVMPRLSVATKINPQGISSIPSMVQDYLADPLIHHQVTVRWGAEILACMPATLQAASRFEHPLLIQHGIDDPINSPEGSRIFIERCGHTDRSLKLYPGSRHEVHHDVGAAQFGQDLVEWIEARLDRPSH